MCEWERKFREGTCKSSCDPIWPYYAAVGTRRKLSDPRRNFPEPPSVWSRMASGDGSWRCTGRKSTRKQRDRGRKAGVEEKAGAVKTRASCVAKGVLVLDR